MKKLLVLFGVVTLMGASAAGLTSCQNKLTPEELSELKIKNKIKTNNEKIKANLEGMSATEKPFEKLDNKWYFVVYRKRSDFIGNIIKFNNNHGKDDKKIHYLSEVLKLGIADGDLYNVPYETTGSQDEIHYLGKRYFKAVYRGNLDTDVPDLDVYAKTGEVKVSEE